MGKGEGGTGWVRGREGQGGRMYFNLPGPTG